MESVGLGGARQPVRLDQFVSIQQYSHEGEGPGFRRDNESETAERRVFGSTIFLKPPLVGLVPSLFWGNGLGSSSQRVCVFSSVIRHCCTYWYDVAAVFFVIRVMTFIPDDQV